MELKSYEPYHNGDWGIALLYYLDGIVHIPLMNNIGPWIERGSDSANEQDLNFNFEYYLNKPYQDHLVYSPEPSERVEGFVYGGVRVKKSLINEEEFDQIDRSLYRYDPGYIREIWKYYFTQTWRGIKTYSTHPDGKVAVDKSPLSIK